MTANEWNTIPHGGWTGRQNHGVPCEVSLQATNTPTRFCFGAKSGSYCAPNFAICLPNQDLLPDINYATVLAPESTAPQGDRALMGRWTWEGGKD